MKFPLYNLWMDNMFYVYLGALAFSLFGAGYSLRRLFAAAAPDAASEPAPEAFPEEPQEPLELIEEFPAPAAEPAGQAEGDKTLLVSNVEELIAASAAEPFAEPAPAADPDKTLVVENVGELIAGKEIPGVEELISSAEAAAAESEPQQPAESAPRAGREAEAAPGSPAELVRGIYSRISGMDARVRAIEEHLKTGEGRHFTAKFLEGILEDFDALSEPKIKARLEYLLSDLKEARERGETDQAR